jgi:uncharacterized protein (DUF924 family)
VGTFLSVRACAIIASLSEADGVLSYWFEPAPTTPEELDARHRFWFSGGSATDDEIRSRFAPEVARARAGELATWSETPRGALALIILIDQFSRNVYRGLPEAFTCDHVALALARGGYDAGSFEALSPLEHLFAAMPFTHAENVEDQKRGVALSVHRALHAPELYRKILVDSVDFARKHLDVIVRFGRFPHRNAALGRVSTPEEREYLEYLKLAGQWL